jgi:hypothetical protein
MFFQDKSSMWSRTAHVLVILCFVTAPLHFMVHRRHFLQGALLCISFGVFLFALLVAVLRKPRDAPLALCAFLAWFIHGLETAAI